MRFFGIGYPLVDRLLNSLGFRRSQLAAFQESHLPPMVVDWLSQSPYLTTLSMKVCACSLAMKTIANLRTDVSRSWAGEM
jgi:hypothetical protein